MCTRGRGNDGAGLRNSLVARAKPHGHDAALGRAAAEFRGHFGGAAVHLDRLDVVRSQREQVLDLREHVGIGGSHFELSDAVQVESGETAAQIHGGRARLHERHRPAAAPCDLDDPHSRHRFQHVPQPGARAFVQLLARHQVVEPEPLPVADVPHERWLDALRDDAERLQRDGLDAHAKLYGDHAIRTHLQSGGGQQGVAERLDAQPIRTGLGEVKLENAVVGDAGDEDRIPVRGQHGHAGTGDRAVGQLVEYGAAEDLRRCSHRHRQDDEKCDPESDEPMRTRVHRRPRLR